MRKQSRKAKDVNEMAFSMAQAIADGGPMPKTADGKNPLAVALGRMGGLKGGKARAAKMTAKQRSDSAKKAAQARWATE
jgi:hypothetical protein